MIILAIILYTTGYTRCFLASMICFPLGIFSYENYDRIRAFLSTLRGKLISLLILIAGFALSYLDYEVLLNISFQSSEGIKAIFNNVLCLGFTCLLWIFLDNYKPGNSILKFLTRISTEIYFMQFIFIAIAEEMKLAYPIKIIMVVGMDILVSLLWNMTKKSEVFRLSG
jgi:hypothetical protein